MYTNKMAGKVEHDGFVLGIDLGTTSVKAVLINTKSKLVHLCKSADTQAATVSDIGSQGNEQDPSRIITSLQHLISRFPREKLMQVVKIGISGQMHGVILWKKLHAWSKNQFGRFELEETSNLFTWQDGRCTPSFLQSLPKHNSHLKLATGQGCATIFWFAKNRPDFLQKYDRAGTIQDLLVSVLCDLEKTTMSVHNAASWGYYSSIEGKWNLEILSEAGFPIHLLPDVQDPGAIAGHLSSDWYGIPQGVPVGVALGDLQCSLIPNLEKETDAALNIGTSAQVAFRMSPGFIPHTCNPSSPVEYFPYFDKTFVAVAASLTGGNVLKAFVKMVQQWAHELGNAPPESEIWKRMTEEGEECEETDLEIIPTIFGERHNPGQLGSVHNITIGNTGLGSVSRALCRGVIANLHNMMSSDFLLAAKVQRIVGSGAALEKNPLLRKEVEKHYRLPVVYHKQANAAVGAALALF